MSGLWVAHHLTSILHPWYSLVDLLLWVSDSRILGQASAVRLSALHLALDYFSQQRRDCLVSRFFSFKSSPYHQLSIAFQLVFLLIPCLVIHKIFVMAKHLQLTLVCSKECFPEESYLFLVQPQLFSVFLVVRSFTNILSMLTESCWV